MKTAIVILNWNTEGFLEKFLPGLLRSAEKAGDAEVIVADNASTDGSAAMMKKKFPGVRTIVFDSNLGFTGGYNRAFGIIGKDTAPEYFVLINSDIEVTEDWLGPLADWMDSHPECGACAPKLHSIQDRDMFEYAGAAGGCLDKYGYPFCRGRIMGRVEKDCGQYDSPQNVFWATGACLMVRSRLFRETGGLDSRFFAHMEEIDLCWRLQLSGYAVTVVPQSLVYHVGGGTLPQTSPFKLFLNYRNNLLMLGNNLGKTFALLAYRSGMSPEKAAKSGIRKARRRIFWRMVLDGCSAAVYLVTFRAACFRAVIDAHREYRKLQTAATQQEVQEYLESKGSRAAVCGWYRKWIIPQAIFCGKHIPEKIGPENFINFGN